MNRRRSATMLFQDKASAMGGHLRGKAAAAKRDQDREPSSGQLDAVYAPCDSVESVLLLMHRIAQDPCGDVIAVTVEHQCMLWRLVLRREAEAGKSNEKNDAERKNRMASMMQAIAQRSRMAEEHVRARAREQIAERANVVNTSQIVKTLSPEETTEFWNRDTLKEVGKGDKLLFGSTGPVSRYLKQPCKFLSIESYYKLLRSPKRSPAAAAQRAKSLDSEHKPEPPKLSPLRKKAKTAKGGARSEAAPDKDPEPSKPRRESPKAAESGASKTSLKGALDRDPKPPPKPRPETPLENALGTDPKPPKLEKDGPANSDPKPLPREPSIAESRASKPPLEKNAAAAASVQRPQSEDMEICDDDERGKNSSGVDNRSSKAKPRVDVAREAPDDASLIGITKRNISRLYLRRSELQAFFKTGVLHDTIQKGLVVRYGYQREGMAIYQLVMLKDKLEKGCGMDLSQIKCKGISKGSRILTVNLGEISNKEFSQVGNSEILDLSIAISAFAQRRAVSPTFSEFLHARKSILRARARVDCDNELKRVGNLRDKANSEGRRQGMKRLIRLMDETREKYKDELVRIDALVESVDRIAEEHKERQHFEREKARAKKLKSDKAAALDTRSQPVKPNAHGAIRPPRPLHSHQRQPRPPVLAVKTAAEADTIKLKTALQSQASPRALSNTSGSPKLQVGNDETTANSQNPDPRTSTSPSSPKTQDRASDDGFQGLSDGLMLEEYEMFASELGVPVVDLKSRELWYYVGGSDGKQYGPWTLETLAMYVRKGMPETTPIYTLDTITGSVVGVELPVFKVLSDFGFTFE